MQKPVSPFSGGSDIHATGAVNPIIAVLQERITHLASGAESTDFEVEAFDAKGRIALFPKLANRSSQKEAWRRIATA